jgi:hypothetical protein
VDGGQPVVQPEAGGAQRRPAVVGQRAADGQAIPAHRRRLSVVAPLKGAFDGAHPAHFLLEQHFGVAVRLKDRLGGLPQVMELAQLVGHLGQRGPHGVANRLLPVGDDAANRHRERGGDLAQQRHQLLLGAAEQAARQQDLARQAVAQHPQHLVPDIGLEPIQCQDDLFLPGQARPQAGLVGQAQRYQLLVAVERVRDAALRDGHPARRQRPVDLGHAAVLAVAQRPDQGDDVEAELAVRQRPAALLLRAIGPAIQRAGRIAAQPHHQGQVVESIEGGDGAVVVVGHPRDGPAVRALGVLRLQPIAARGGRAGGTAGHGHLLPDRDDASGGQPTTRRASLPA